jgi:hypothetical protein
MGEKNAYTGLLLKLITAPFSGTRITFCSMASMAKPIFYMLFFVSRTAAAIT